MAKQTKRKTKNNTYEKIESIDTTLPIVSTEHTVADYILMFWPIVVFTIAAIAAFFFAPEITIVGLALYVWSLVFMGVSAGIGFIKVLRKKSR